MYFTVHARKINLKTAIKTDGIDQLQIPLFLMFAHF